MGLAVLVAVTVAKVVLAATLGWSEDVNNYYARAQSVLSGKWPGLPASAWLFPMIGDYFISALCLLIAQASGLSFGFIFKLPSIVADFIIALLILRISGGSMVASMLYMVNPVTISLSVYHGQLHTVAVCAVVLALWLADRGRFYLGACVLAIAAVIRQHFAPLLLSLVARRGRFHYGALLIFCIAFLILNIPFVAFQADPEAFRITVMPYGTWGYSMLLLQGPRVLEFLDIHALDGVLQYANEAVRQHLTIGPALWVSIFVAWSVWHPHRHLWQSTLLFVLGLYTMSAGIGVQYLVWALPFFIVVSLWRALVYSALAGVFIVGNYAIWRLNGKYGVESFTANLQLLSLGELTTVFFVGFVGLGMWLFCAHTSWILLRQPDVESYARPS